MIILMNFMLTKPVNSQDDVALFGYSHGCCLLAY